MPRILVDARCIADPHGGGVARVAKRWILAHKAEHPGDTYTCFTTGLHPSDAVRLYCDEHELAYLHVHMPNKLWTIASLLGISPLPLRHSCEGRNP